MVEAGKFAIAIANWMIWAQIRVRVIHWWGAICFGRRGGVLSDVVKQSPRRPDLDWRFPVGRIGGELIGDNDLIRPEITVKNAVVDSGKTDRTPPPERDKH
jgi:hypothetical protein